MMIFIIQLCALFVNLLSICDFVLNKQSNQINQSNRITDYIFIFHCMSAVCLVTELNFYLLTYLLV